jgi:ABC-2 type transport system permease protein
MPNLANIYFVAQKDLLQLVRDRGGLILMFAVPLALMGILGAAIGTFSSEGNLSATLPVVDRAQTTQSRVLIADLRRVPNLTVQIKSDLTNQETSVRDGNTVGLLIIPTSFGRGTTKSTIGGKVDFYSVTNNTSVNTEFAEDAVRAVVQRLSFESVTAQAVARGQQLAGGRPNSHQVTSLAGKAARELTTAPPVSLRLLNATGRTFSAASNAVPGYALMFALFAVTASAGTILKEKEQGTLKRLLIAPVSSAELLGGKLVAQFVQTLVQVAVLFAAGSLLFHIDLGSSFPALICLIVGTAFAATGIGMLLVSFVKSQAQLRPITTLVVLSFSALGGSWWPISGEPRWMQQLSDLTLNAWAMRGFNGLMIFDKSFAQVAPDIIALFIYGAICFIVARWAFRLRGATI